MIQRARRLSPFDQTQIEDPAYWQGRAEEAGAIAEQMSGSKGPHA